MNGWEDIFGVFSFERVPGVEECVNSDTHCTFQIKVEKLES